MPRIAQLTLAVLVIAALCRFAYASATAPLARTNAPDRWWPTYGGTYGNTRHFELAQIRPETVAALRPAWTFSTGVSGQIETSPVAVDGTLYVTTGPDNGVFALNAATGTLKWHYVPKVGPAAYIFAVNRGVAVAAGRVFFTTLDNALIALDARNGKPVWITRVGDSRQGLSEAAAPLAWGGLVFVGSSGGELGVRGSYSAYSQQDGRLVWRWWSVSRGWEGNFAATIRGFALHRDTRKERATARRYADAWKHGGGAIWMTPALSPQDKTIYLSTGNPAPAFNGDLRPGDNLYTDCIVALDARSGRLKWHYQETPHDVWDYDASSPPMLFDTVDAGGRRVPAVGQAGKTGWLYIVDRRTGRLIRVSAPFVPQPAIYHALSPQGEPVQPGDGGGALGPMAYDPLLRAAFVAGNVLPEIGQTFPPTPWRAGEAQWKAGEMHETAQHESSLISRIDVDSGRIVWSKPVHEAIFGGPLSTSGLVFVGEQTTGAFKAYAAADGNVLWQVSPGDGLGPHPGLRERVLDLVSKVKRLRHADWIAAGDIHAPAIAYRMNGREFIVVSSNVFRTKSQPGGDTVFAYALP